MISGKSLPRPSVPLCLGRTGLPSIYGLVYGLGAPHQRPPLRQESAKNVPDFGRLLGLRQSASATRRVAQSLDANTQSGGIHSDENTAFGGGTCITVQSDLQLQIPRRSGWQPLSILGRSFPRTWEQGGDVYATGHREGWFASIDPRVTSLGGSISRS